MATRGDDGPPGYAEFVRGSYVALSRAAYLLTGDRGRAEDAVQTALVRTLGAWHRLASPDAAEAYTRTTMVRIIARGRRRRWSGELPAPRQELLDDLADADAGGDVDTSLDVRRVLATLPFPQRAVLVLRYLDDLSERDTAAALGCSVGTVKSRTSRALAALRVSGALAPDRREAHDG